MNFEQIKNILENNFFKKKKFSNSYFNDGRLESAMLEDEAITTIEKIFEKTDVIVSRAPKARYWYDIKFETEEKFYPINIKITSGISADNLNSKEGLFFALTGLNPDKAPEYKGCKRSWECYNKQLLDNLRITDEDYYFIVIFKDTGKILFTSLKRLNKLVPNGSNLPFQCKWNDNLDYTTRTEREQEKYLIDMFVESFVRKSRGLDILLKWRDKND